MILLIIGYVALYHLVTLHYSCHAADDDNNNNKVNNGFGSIALVGRTGDGKSAFANLIANYFEYSQSNPFDEGHSVSSHTRDPQTVTIDGFKVIDTPGLLDDGGHTQDELNIVKIVRYLKEDGHLKGIIVVINSQSPRFDHGMQIAVKLLVDSFGPQMLTHMGLLFTREIFNDKALCRSKTEQIRDIISSKTGYDIDHIPFWLVDNHPEQLSKMKTPQIYIDSIHERNKESMMAIKLWSSQLDEINMESVQIGEYEEAKQLREAAAQLEEMYLNTIDSFKTKGECKEVEVRRVGNRSRRYGRKCIAGLFGGRVYADFWDDVTISRSCRSEFIKVNGEHHSFSDWEPMGEFTRQENRRKVDMC